MSHREPIQGQLTHPHRGIQRRRSGTFLQQTLASPNDENPTVTNVTTAVCGQLRFLLSNPIYIIITLGLSDLYFVVTGMQFWVTEYLIIAMKQDKLLVVSATTFTFLTSPTSGVYFGGWIVDYFGGYKGDELPKAIKLGTIFAGCSALFGITACCTTNLFIFIPVIWLMLFSGGALVPVCVGVAISSVPGELRSTSSAISQFTYNILGWFAAPLISGGVMDAVTIFDSRPERPLEIGFRFVLLSSTVGFFLCLGANCVVPKSNNNPQHTELELS